MMSRPTHTILLLACLFLAAAPVRGQTPCHDTAVVIYDSICEGLTYDFNGRILDHTGTYYDTLQRIGSDCDSFIRLRLSVLDTPEVILYPSKKCKGNIGYDLYGSGIGSYFLWSSQPHDPAVDSQQYQPSIHVNPHEPTTYSLYVDYRETPQCPGSGSRLLNPIVPLVANMHIEPDEVTLDQMEFTVEDFSTNTREYHWGGWSGRYWYINGVEQSNTNECATFAAHPDWPDTLVIMMQAFTTTCLDTVIKILPFKKVALYFPNIFTPDGESNTRFGPVLLGVMEFEMWLYDRRGRLIFHTTSADDPWDGTFQGAPCPQGVYTYRCRYKDIITPQGYQSRSGTILLLR